MRSGSLVARLTHWEGESLSFWSTQWRVPVLEVHDELGSTNDRLKDLSGQGVGHFSVVIAESQIAGRGRRGNTWHSPAGSGLWMSVLLPAPSPSAAYLPLIVGLAAARAVERVASGLEAGIEWPNDVMVRGKKVAGVLCEAVRGVSDSSEEAVVAGIGINVRTPPGGFAPDIVTRATFLEAALGGPVPRAALAGALVGELMRATDAGGLGLGEKTLAALNCRDVLSNRRVLTEQEGPGIARGVLASGALLLARQAGSPGGVGAWDGGVG